jgi:hypothetical protein
LYTKAIEAVQAEFGGDEPLSAGTVYAMAVLIEEALHSTQRAKAKARRESGPLPFTGAQVHERMASELPSTFAYQPVDATWWGRLNSQIRTLDIDEAALDTLIAWFKVGRGATFKKGMSFAVVVANFKLWLTEALREANPTPSTSAGSYGFVRPSTR